MFSKTSHTKQFLLALFFVTTWPPQSAFFSPGLQKTIIFSVFPVSRPLFLLRIKDFQVTNALWTLLFLQSTGLAGFLHLFLLGSRCCCWAIQLTGPATCGKKRHQKNWKSLLGCPGWKLGSMVRKWIISPTYKSGILGLKPIYYPFTNFLGHPSTPFPWKSIRPLKE